MPLHIIANDNPRRPAWGELPLEVYFLSEWEKSHPDPSQSNESPAARRKRLISQFLALGYEGRMPYLSQPRNPPPIPTEAQIEEILRPIRPEALRTYAYNTGADSGLWLRLCYTDEEAHNSLWSDNEDADWVTYGGVVLDDESIFGGLDLAAALEIFPERVTNEAVCLEVRDQELKDIVAAEQESSDSGEDDYSDELKERIARQRAYLEENPLSSGGWKMMDQKIILMALGLSALGKVTLNVIEEKLALPIIRVEAEGRRTLFDGLELLGTHSVRQRPPNMLIQMQLYTWKEYI
ncbi:hypothetical protein N7523_000444 [Penicillium sp. IBT 18751x]|nr:hypothetical protein N7523_000444 [Penicillium sp. IBT 18751x]